MGRIDETVVVLVDALGIPTCFRWREKDYFVGSEPVRWFARAEWWIGERVQRGIGSGVLEVEMWRFKVTDGGIYEVLHNSLTGAWKLIRRFE